MAITAGGEGESTALEATLPQVLDQALVTDVEEVAVACHTTNEDGHGRHEERYLTQIADRKSLPSNSPNVAELMLIGTSVKSRA